MEENGMEDLKAWVAHNKNQFKTEKYTHEHIRDLAIACGFDRQAVAQWLTSVKFQEAAKGA